MKSQNTKKSIIFIAVIIAIIVLVSTVKTVIKLSSTNAETKRAMTYGQLQEEDSKTQSENVEFSAFFTRDLNNDGYAERIKGTCVDITGTDTLYAELKVERGGYLKDGKISLNAKNFTWNTSIVGGDNIVDGNYIGNINSIKLADKVYSGREKLFIGKINSNVNLSNIYNYSQISSMTLTGTYVDDEGNETPINETKEFTVDWYGNVGTRILTTTQDQNTSLSNDSMEISFYVETQETINKLILKENVVTVEIPELHGYKAKDVKVQNSNVNYDFNQEKGILTITSESAIDDNGNITKGLATINKYNIVAIYPREARGDTVNDNKLNFDIEFPVTSTYRAYNNQNKEFEKIVESKAEGRVALVENKGFNYHGDCYDIKIGDKIDYNRYLVSKEKAVQAYNDEDTKEDYYNVKWYCSPYSISKKIMEGKDVIVSTDGKRYDVTEFVRDREIYFGGVNDNVKISIYNNDTNELIHTFSNGEAKKYTYANPYKFDDDVINIRVELDEVSDVREILVVQKKEIDDKALVNKFSRDEFNKFQGIYSYLYASAPGNYEKTQLMAYAEYKEKESDVQMSLIKKEMSTISTQEKEIISIQTKSNGINQMQWKNGQFLVKFPNDIIYAKINNVTISNPLVNILGYDLYKEGNIYFARILTSNEEEQLYSINIDCDVVLNPTATTGSEAFTLYAYNEKCNTYFNSAEDIYDVNNNNNTKETVGRYLSYLNILAPTSLLTSQTATNYDDSGNITIAPNIADISKQTRTVDINVNMLNNYKETLSETKIIGSIPYKNNSYTESGEKLGSEFSSQITEQGIQVPDNLKDIVTVYYTENGEATKDIYEETNGWTKDPTDWTKVRKYLIDFNDYIISSGASYTFKYTVKIPEGIDYNKVSYSAYAIDFSLNTDNGKLQTQIEPNKLGIRIARKYNIDIIKYNKENNIVVPGAVYKLTELDEAGNEISSKLITTNTEGKLIAKEIYVNRTYTLQEIKNPEEYMLNEAKIKFIVTENEQGQLEIKVLSEDNFRNTPKIENNTLTAELEDEPKYQIIITKKDGATNEVLQGVKFFVQEQGTIYTTNSNGQVAIKNLEKDKEYTLKEIYADGYYLLNDIKFKLIKEENGKFKIDSENEIFKNAEVEVANNEALLKANIELVNDKEPSIIINKTDKATGEPIKNIKFAIEGRDGKEYVTNDEGKVEINGFEENKEYTLKEIKADGYYLQSITFTIVRENGKLKINSDNKEFANATIADETRKILNVNLTNEKIPTYNLHLQKIAKGNDKKGLPGAQFRFINEDQDIITEYTTDETGSIDISNLYEYVEGKYITGNYTLQEIKAPDGYSNNAEEIKFKVTKNSEGKLEIIVENKENLQTIKDVQIEENKVNLIIEDQAMFTLTKTDKETGKLLANAKFIIKELDDNRNEIDYAKDINGNYVGTKNDEGQYIVTTDENGKVVLPLRKGNYVIIEVEYPEGYTKEDIMQYFQVYGNETNSSELEKEVSQINCIEDLVELSNQVRAGNSYADKTITLQKTLDFNDDASYNDPLNTNYGDLNGDGTAEGIKTELTKEEGKGFMPIGLEAARFNGTFDGQENEIRNIYINRPDEDYVGLFGNIDNGNVKNIGISGKITGKNYVGGISGNVGNISNCYNMAIIEGIDYVGGISGGNGGQINNCYNTGNIESTGNYVGGISYNPNTISNCYNIGNVSGNKYVGAITCNDSVSNSYYLQSINITGQNQVTSGTSKIADEMKTKEFAENLSRYNFVQDTENKNNGYPILKYHRKEINNVETIEDLVELSQQVKDGYNYANSMITLSKTLDFNEDSSYLNSESTEYGDLNEDGIVEGIKVELTKEEGKGFIPISTFYGTFDGNFNEIRNIYINRPDVDYIGLFGCINRNGNVKNIGISGKIIGNNYVGGIAGSGNIFNCYNNAIITGNNNVGGIAGYGNINNCYNTAIITGQDKVGGIAGEANNIISCYNIGNVNATTNVGAISGNKPTTGTNCYYLYGIEIVGDSQNDFGEAVEENNMKTEEFVGKLGNRHFEMDTENKNKGYPVIKDGVITQIESIEDLVELSKQVEFGNNYANVTIALLKTLDFNDDESYENPESTEFGDLNGDGIVEGVKTELTKEEGKGFKPIGVVYNSTFSGTFDGQENEINNLYINIPDEYYAGLFGYVNGGNIKNLTISGKIVGNSYVGGIVGFINSDTKITNCKSKGDITSNSYAGGIVGFLPGRNNTIIDCQNELVINGSYSGGIIGYVSSDSNTNIIANCNNKGQVTGNNYAGGIAGYLNSNGTITNCNNKGQVTGNNYAGGIAGYLNSNGTITNCSNEGNIKGNDYAGGIAGYLNSNSTITNCNNKGDITGNNSNAYAGGIVGSLSSSSAIAKCNNEGKVIGNGYVAGGIVGFISPGGNITECSNEGNVTSKSNYTGGIVGNAGYNETTIENCKNKSVITILSSNNGSLYVGGISGSNGNVKNSYNIGDIINNSSIGGYIGGIIGTYGNIVNCYNAGNITNNCSNNDNYIGGIVGTDGSVVNCYNVGDIINNSSSNSVNYNYIGGISGSYVNSIVNSYNTGNIRNVSSNYINYIGGICGQSTTITNCYNTGNIENKLSIYLDNSYPNYIGGLEGAYGNISNSYNAGNLNVEINNFASNASISNWVGGLVGNLGSVSESYGLGNIKYSYTSTTDVTPYVNIGKLIGYGTPSNEDCYYSDNAQLEVESESTYNLNEYGKVETAENINMPGIKSQEFFDIINTDGVWTHINGYHPKLFLSKTQLGDSTELDIQNTIEKFNITTDVEEKEGIKGGSITGEDEDPYEVVRYGEENEKEIKMQPDEGYVIGKITINNEPISFVAEKDGSYTIPTKYIKNIKENKKIVVSYIPADELLTIKKVDKANKEKVLPGAKFTIETAGEDGNIQLVTDENGQIKQMVEVGKEYTIKEIQAPDGYILNSTPITFTPEAGKDNVIEITNEEKPKLVVHHYLKDNDGKYTTVKVADDETTVLEPNSKYQTEPKIDLENLDLEKDENGNYVVPQNAIGTAITGKIEVNYYYEAKPIELNIHHYWSGSSTKLAEDETIKYKPTINIVDNKVETVNVNEKYEVASNANYKELIKTHELTLIVHDGETVTLPEKEPIEPEKLAKTNIKTKAKLLSNQIADTIEAESSETENSKDEITFANNSELTYYYTSDTKYLYTVEYYYDGVLDESKTDTIEASYQDVIKEYKDKSNKFYSLEKVENLPLVVGEDNSKNVIKVYYKKNVEDIKEISYTVEYYKDGQRVDSDTQVEKQQVLTSESDTINVDRSKINVSNKYEGYTFEKTDPEKIPSIVNNGDVIKVYYTKIPEEYYTYKVEYYYDGVKDFSKTKTEKALEGTIITTYEPELKENYKLEKVENLPLVVSNDIDKNRIKVYYVRDTFKISIKHLDYDTKKVIVEETINKKKGEKYTTEAKEFEDYDLKEKPENAEGIVTEDLTVNYYYIKKAKVEVKYLDKETKEEIGEKEIINGHINDKYTTAVKDIKYYNLDSIEGNKTGIMEDELTQVIYYYTKKSFNLKVDKQIKQIIVDEKEQKITNGKLEKVEIYRKKLDNTTIKVVYKIIVTNDGEICGKTKIIENIPGGMNISEEESKEWKLEEGKATLETEEIKPGETKEYEIVLTWKQGENNIGEKVNTAEMGTTENEANFQEKDSKDNKAEATLIITVSTGDYEIIQYIVASITISLLVFGVITITRRKTVN